MSYYTDWLAKDGVQRILLIEVKYWDVSSGTEKTEYISVGGYVSLPGDTPANQVYQGICYKDVEIITAMGGGLNSGSINMINENGRLDAWLDDSVRAWDGRLVQFFLGDKSWSRSQFVNIFTGVIKEIRSHRRDKLRFDLYDLGGFLDVPVQTNLLTTGPLVNQPVPLCCGECFNVEPVLIDAALLKYKIHDGEINAILDVRFNGVSTALYTADLLNGEITLTANPNEQTVTVDVQGAKPAGVYKQTTADIIEYLVTLGILTTANIDLANFAQMNIDQPANIGIYIREERTLADTLDELMESIGGYWRASRDGLLQLGRILAPSGTPVLTLPGYKEFEIKERIAPIASAKRGYKKNYQLQNGDLNGAVTEANKVIYGEEFSQVSSSDPTVKTKHPLALDNEMKPTNIVSQADAQTECDRILALNGGVVTIYKYETKNAALETGLGDVVTIKIPRFGFDLGQDAVVQEIVEKPCMDSVTLELRR